MVLHPVPAFSDNYIWVLHNDTAAVVVDPGEPGGVLAYLQAQGLQTAAILVTHHHADHTAGALSLREATGARLLGPSGEWSDADCERVAPDTTLELLGLHWQVMDVPGHTAGHVAYLAKPPGADAPSWLFCGDTLFSGGCGRNFEGSPGQMLASLDALAALPGHTQVCCAHEYTLNNLRFALAVDPHNTALADWYRECQALRAAGLPTLPSHIARERDINPFLRVRHPALIEAARQQDASADTPEAVFSILRTWKNRF